MSLLSSEGVSFGGSQSLFAPSANVMTPVNFQSVAHQEVLVNPTRQVQNSSGQIAGNTERVEAVVSRLQPFTQQLILPVGTPEEAMFPGAPNFPKPDRPGIGDNWRPIDDDRLPHPVGRPIIEPPIMGALIENQPRFLDHLLPHPHIPEEVLDQINPPPPLWT